MGDLTTELNLALAIDDDDLADYLVLPAGLRGSLIVLDGLFNSGTGHNHNGAHQGGALTGIPGSALVDDSVTSAKIQNGTIATADIADGAITSAKIADGTIATADLADGSVTSAKIADSTITGSDIAASTITGANIAAGTISGGHIVDGSIGPADIAAGAIGNTQLATGAVDSRAIADNSISTADLADGAVTGPKVAANAVLNDPRITGEGPTPVTGSYDLGAPTAGKWRFVKAWGGALTVSGTGATGLAGPGATAMAASFVIQNGDSVSMYADGTYWWCI